MSHRHHYNGITEFNGFVFLLIFLAVTTSCALCCFFCKKQAAENRTRSHRERMRRQRIGGAPHISLILQIPARHGAELSQPAGNFLFVPATDGLPRVYADFSAPAPLYSVVMRDPRPARRAPETPPPPYPAPPAYHDQEPLIRDGATH